MGNSNFCCSNKPENQGELNMNKSMNQKITTKFEAVKIDEEDFKVKGELENYDSNKNLDNGVNLRLLVKVQSCVRRFLQTSKFLKEHRNNKSKVIELKKKEFLKSLEGIHMDFKDQSKLAEYKSEYNSILNNKNTMYNFSNMNDNFEYKGFKEKGMKEGFGIQIWKDGAIYKGYFSKNKANGYGVFRHHDGDKYKGEFFNNRASGYGIYLHSNGALYEGYWLDDCQNGIGEECWNDDSNYFGEYYMGKKQGLGRYKWGDNSVYEGEWFENCLHGYGIYYFNDGRIYSGQWQYNSMHGYGEFRWADGKKYAGYYIHDKKEGFGIYYWANPLRVYLGFWKNGKQDGVGKYFNGNRPPKYGIWKNGDKIEIFQDEEQAFKNLLPTQEKYVKFFRCTLPDIQEFLA